MLPGNLRALLGNGQWGDAFLGLVQGIRTPIGITAATIDSIFAWDESVQGQLKDSYVRAIEDLLQLPLGISLVRNMIIAHHCMAGLPKLNFIKHADSKSNFYVYDFPDPCKINLGYKRNNHIRDKWKLIAVNTTLPAGTLNHPGSQIDFVDVSVPPSISLAHELGHYLQHLTACKKVMDRHHKCVSEAIVVTDDILSPRIRTNRFAIKADYRAELSARLNESIDVYFELEWSEIMSNIIPNLTPVTPAQKAFVEVWDGDKPEISNILPGASILQDGGSDYSDGAIIGEAVLQGKIVIPNVGGRAVDYAGLPREGFVRFSHQDSSGFMKHFNALTDAGKDEFRDLTQLLLNKIMVGGYPLSAAHNNLPGF
jgi:hypothetical protein